MKATKTLLAILLLIIMLFSALPSKAYVHEIGSSSITIHYGYYLDDNGTAVLLDTLGYSAHLDIPSSIEEHTVTQISGYSLDYLYHISTVFIPDTITFIEGNPFQICHGLQGIRVSPDNPVFAEIGGVLYNIKEKKLIAFPPSYPAKNYQIPEGTLAIGAGAFSNASMLTSVSIPDSVTTIEDNAFYNCTNLESVTLSKKLTSISASSFENCRSLNSISIPDGVQTIGESAFARCFNLSSVSLPQTLSSIEYDAFLECYNLTSINLPSSISRIDTDALTLFPKLSNLTVDKDSYAEQWAKESFIPYHYSHSSIDP